MTEKYETLFKVLFADIEELVIATIEVRKDHSVQNHNRTVDAKYNIVGTLTKIGKRLDNQ